MGGGYLKGGANINFSEKSNVFFNAGMISRQPLFDAIFPGYANDINEDAQNEEITSFELGYGYISNAFKLNINAYSTNWGNRFISRGFTIDGGIDGTAQFSDIDVLHEGIEVEATLRPSSVLKLRGMLSLGNWRYVNDFTSAVFDDNNNQIGEGTIYAKDAKVGDAAQFVTYLSADYRMGNVTVDLGYRFVDQLYADYSITDNELLTPDNRGAVKLPSYGLVDLGATAYFGDFSLRANINNLFDTTYIAESNSNIHADATSTTWNGVDVRNYVWFGFGTTWNLNLRYRF